MDLRYSWLDLPMNGAGPFLGASWRQFLPRESEDAVAAAAVATADPEDVDDCTFHPWVSLFGDNVVLFVL